MLCLCGHWAVPTPLTDVVVVGAGMAGLACAADLTQAGVPCTVIEASDGVGGRVRTDLVDGFQLDRGFQILLTAYPQVQARLDLDALDLRPFAAGAVVRTARGMARVEDPLRRPTTIPATLAAPIGSLADKVRVAALVARIRMSSVTRLLSRPEVTTRERLTAAGFSDWMIETFWRPLFAGIQLDPDLEVSSYRFDLILRMLATGPTAVPAQGMGAIAVQMAANLPPGTLALDSRVERLVGTTVHRDDGHKITARAVVVATEGPEAHRLLGASVPDPGSRAVACCWFSAPTTPVAGRALVLDGTGNGPARNLAVLSEVAPTYAPQGRSLVAAAVPGPDAKDPRVTTRVVDQLSRWFGSTTTEWSHLRTDVIPHGQPLQVPPLDLRQSVDLGEGVFVAGDHRDTASLQGALVSGGRAARAVVAHLAG